jgi:hypothetical protein
MIEKRFHDDGETPADRLHPEDQKQIRELKDALAGLAEFSAGLKQSFTELRESVAKPRTVTVVRGTKGEIVGARAE